MVTSRLADEGADGPTVVELGEEMVNGGAKVSFGLSNSVTCSNTETSK
jgi:hypothetical protein